MGLAPTALRSLGRVLYLMSYQGSSAGRGSNLQHKIYNRDLVSLINVGVLISLDREPDILHHVSAEESRV